jgi:hypothetical protein
MAEEVRIDESTGALKTAKIRHPVAVPVFVLITLGIYGLYWWYQVNREMRDLGRARNAVGLGDNPLISLLAVFPGVLILVPPIVSLYNGVQRAQRAQGVVLGSSTLNGWVVLGVIAGGFIIPFLGLVAYGYIQSELNKVWEQLGGAQLQATASPAAVEAPAPEAESATPPPAETQ